MATQLFALFVCVRILFRLCADIRKRKYANLCFLPDICNSQGRKNCDFLLTNLIEHQVKKHAWSVSVKDKKNSFQLTILELENWSKIQWMLKNIFDFNPYPKYLVEIIGKNWIFCPWFYVEKKTTTIQLMKKEIRKKNSANWIVKRPYQRKPSTK